MTAVAQVRVLTPATCGELLQGVDSEGPVLVSLPVELMGSVEVTLSREGAISVSPDLPRARAALDLVLDRTGWRGGVAVRLGGEVPRSRGMGSSTVDVAGVLLGVCRAAGVELGNAELVGLMTRVEPSDSSPLRGLWAIDHVDGRRALALGDGPPGVWLAAVDSGVPVATADVHRACGAGPRIPDGVIRSLDWDSPVAVGRLAGESALRNQERLPHAAFGAVRTVARRAGALGVFVAHSGSLCGVMCAGRSAARSARDALAAEGLRAEVLRAAAPGSRVVVVSRPQTGGLVPQRPVS
jgi:L-threonine kinase